VGGKIFALVFLGGLTAGRAKSKKYKDKAGIKGSFLKTNKYAILAAQQPPRASFKPPKRAVPDYFIDEELEL